MSSYLMSGFARAIQRSATQSKRESLVDTRAKPLKPTMSASDAEHYKATIIQKMINHIKSKGAIQYDNFYQRRTKSIQSIGTGATSGRLS